MSLHGGQVLSWKTDHGEELLFTSSKVCFNLPPHLSYTLFIKNGLLDLTSLVGVDGRTLSSLKRG